MATGVEFFAFYDIFSGGLFSAILLFLYFWIYTYIAMRGTDKKADEFSLQILLPPLIIAFFLPLFIQNSIIVGFVVLAAYFISYKHYTEVDFNEWLKVVISVMIFLMIFSMLDGVIGLIFMVLFLFFAYAIAERRMHEKRKSKKEEKK